jgi:hypothetical protein
MVLRLLALRGARQLSPRGGGRHLPGRRRVITRFLVLPLPPDHADVEDRISAVHKQNRIAQHKLTNELTNKAHNMLLKIFKNEIIMNVSVLP